MIGFLIGFLAGFAIWHIGFQSGKDYGKELAAQDLADFLNWLQADDRLVWRIRMREYMEEVIKPHKDLEQ